jgi:hypothetical protein
MCCRTTLTIPMYRGKTNKLPLRNQIFAVHSEATQFTVASTDLECKDEVNGRCKTVVGCIVINNSIS